MNNFLNKKLIPALLILSIFVTGSFFALPQKTKAAAAIVNDPANLVQNIIQVGSGITSAAADYSIQFKEFVLDGLGMALAKQVIRQLTTSIVNWINTGFEGSPSFLQNPGGFFLDVADQVTGEFLSKYGGPLVDLCTPFSIDIRLALAFKYHPNTRQKFQCTLSTIIKNSKNAVEGASINGFTAGDFKQGGWPAFVSLTTEPSNNAYGSYLSAESELSVRVANAEVAKRDEVQSGSGFLSWRDRKCKAEVKAHNETVKKNFEDLENASPEEYRATNERISNETSAQNLDDLYNGAAGESYGQTNARVGGDVSQMTRRNVEDCPIQTPGSVIESQLNNSLSGPLRELELADEINEIVNALFAQLAKQVLQKGLGAVTGSGPGDSTSYIGQIQEESIAAGTPELQKAKAALLTNMDSHITNATELKENKDNSVKATTDARVAYEEVKACYAAKISSPTSSLSAREREDAQDEINKVDGLINTKVAPLAAKLLPAAQEAGNRLQTLLDIKTLATAAKTFNELNLPTQTFSTMVQNQSLPNARDLALAREEYSTTAIETDQMIGEARELKRECDLFPLTNRN